MWWQYNCNFFRFLNTTLLKMLEWYYFKGDENIFIESTNSLFHWDCFSTTANGFRNQISLYKTHAHLFLIASVTFSLSVNSLYFNYYIFEVSFNQDSKGFLVRRFGEFPWNDANLTIYLHVSSLLKLRFFSLKWEISLLEFVVNISVLAFPWL